jgi:hypothetical protein
MKDICFNDDHQLCIKKDVLLRFGIYTYDTYRKNKSINRFSEEEIEGDKYVLFDSLPFKTRRITALRIQKLMDKLTMAEFIDKCWWECSDNVANRLANELAEIETFIKIHKSEYFGAYISTTKKAAISKESVNKYAERCALARFIYDKATELTASAKSPEQAQTDIRALRKITLNALTPTMINIPRSIPRFNEWFSNIIKKMNEGLNPEQVITVARKGNKNASKITEEQTKRLFQIWCDGSNMGMRQAHRKWIKEGRKKGWWTNDEGKFDPPSYSAARNAVSDKQSVSILARTDKNYHRNKCLPTAHRMRPPKKNNIWCIDGTAHNENVEHNGTVRQHIYSVKIIDVATNFIVGCASHVGSGEPFSLILEAITMGIMSTGYKPAIIQYDHGPAAVELQKWCDISGISLRMPAIGNARAKPIENVHWQFDHFINRQLPGWSGMNRTAKSINSHPSAAREAYGKRHARSASIAIEWLRTEGIQQWNDHSMETFNHEKCGKSPRQLWDEKESFLPKIDFYNLCNICGTSYTRQFTTDGINIELQGRKFRYFPVINTTELRELAVDIFTTVPIGLPKNSQVTIQIIEPGKPAPVYWRNRLLGVWENMPPINFGGNPETDENLRNYLAFDKRCKSVLKGVYQDIQHDAPDDDPPVETHGVAPPSAASPKKYEGRYDKSALIKQEIADKAGISMQEMDIDPAEAIKNFLKETRQVKTETIVDEATGEVIEIAYTGKYDHLLK